MYPLELFKQLSDTTRLRCLVLMVSEGELCVCELTHALDLSQPKISRHLAQLRESGVEHILSFFTILNWEFIEDLPEWVTLIIQGMQAGTERKEPYRSDLQVLKDMPNRPGATCCA